MVSNHRPTPFGADTGILQVNEVNGMAAAVFKTNGHPITPGP